MGGIGGVEVWDTIVVFEAEDGIRGFWLARGLGDVYKGPGTEGRNSSSRSRKGSDLVRPLLGFALVACQVDQCLSHFGGCLLLVSLLAGPLYTPHAADNLPCVDLGVARAANKKHLCLITTHPHPI